MKPTNWFSIRDKSIDIEETDIDSESLLDFTYKKGLKSRSYMLTKNYRSKSSKLILFYSKKFYNSKLDVIDDKNLNSENSIEVYNKNSLW